jgi:predicted ABC-type ATPase
LNTIREAVDAVLRAQEATRKPLGVILAGHNGSGKSTMWRRLLADRLEIPLINADRMMLSILPEPGEDGHLVPWAARLRDRDVGWMRVAQQGVQTFVGHAMAARVPFAMETVFSYWEEQADGRIASKIDLITNLQVAGYFVLLVFVGLRSVAASITRVDTRVREGGHGVNVETLRRRFPRTQTAIAAALKVVDASILVDNSRTPAEAFTVGRVQVGPAPLFVIRRAAELRRPLLRPGWTLRHRTSGAHRRPYETVITRPLSVDGCRQRTAA